MKIGIMTDVNAGLDYVGYDTGIVCLRSSVNFKNETLVDGIDIKADEFYERLKTVTKAEDVPSTSAPALGDIHDAIQKFIDEGYTDIIHFPISYQLSSTGANVEMVAKEYEDQINVHVIDTKVACYLQGYIAVTAKKMADEGCTVEQIIEKARYMISHNKGYFVVSDLTYLIKNGRLSGFAGFMGQLLKICPVLELTPEGKIEACEKVRTHRKACDELINKMLKVIEGKKNVVLFGLHSLKEELCKEITQKMLEARPDILFSEIHYITPAVGAHTGAGIVGLAAFWED